MAAGREGTDGMSKKLSNNGLWESSRMIIPQHKEALLRHQGERHRSERPQLDEQAWEEIGEQLQRSMMDREAITLNLFDPFERRTIAGIVVDIDMIGQRIRINEGDERYWIRAEDILGVMS